MMTIDHCIRRNAIDFGDSTVSTILFWFIFHRLVVFGGVNAGTQMRLINGQFATRGSTIDGLVITTGLYGNKNAMFSSPLVSDLVR